MSKNTQRLSQLISTFGPGAMVDLPTRSVVIGGLEQWDMKGIGLTTLSEPRLQERLEKLLKDRKQLEPTKKLTLRIPPISDANPQGDPRGVSSPIFPAWFVCEEADGTGAGSAALRRRRLVRWTDLEARGRKRFNFDDGRKSDVTPIRFVCACKKGHLQDIAWRWVVHGSTSCHEPLWVEEKGTSADPADTSVVCGCGQRLSLQDAFQPGRLGKCRGERPWLLDKDPDGCDENLKLLTRTATNTYFPQVLTIISLPSEEDELTELVAELSGELNAVQSVEQVATAKQFNMKVAASLGSYLDHEIFDRLMRIREGAKTDAARSPKIAEFEIFASGRAEIGHNHPNARLYAQTLKREIWANGAADIDLSGIKSLVAVHRLREVSCLYGFTRFEAAPTSSDGDVEDISLAVDGAPIARDADWLPAIEQFGEGLFVHVDENAIHSWLDGNEVKDRDQKLISGFRHWSGRFGGKGPNYPGTPYVLLHSLSHALMAEIALDCGYPASALKERVYALEDSVGGFGILIYTATAGSQGTLGGLVATAPRFATILEAALEKISICSNDPICSDHEPDTQSGDRATHGAACHSCLLIAETSCESRNLFLDRSLLVATMSERATAFFQNGL